MNGTVGCETETWQQKREIPSICITSTYKPTPHTRYAAVKVQENMPDGNCWHRAVDFAL